ncbi:hypothetical protein ANN_03456 [Periplaneta americana]|uniref:E3 ubiquitin-protein ligase n=1 Tax=Periplaneta americana TaxID=6978 RepID=A0ABQ8U0X8_PERAM|nr:hypothetical protein ANN_03456 [Periplaneta americana]
MMGSATVAIIKAERIRWLGHLMGMSEDEIAKKLLFNEAGGIRKKRRPKLRWFDGVTDDLVALGVRNWRRKAQERQTWKRIVEDAKYEVYPTSLYRDLKKRKGIHDADYNQPFNCSSYRERTPDIVNNFNGEYESLSEDNCSSVSTSHLSLRTRTFQEKSLNLRNCPMNFLMEDYCLWRGLPKDIKQHVKQDHHYEICDKNGTCNLRLHKFQNNACWSKVFLAHGEIFVQIYRTEECRFSTVALYVGPKEESRNFKMRITLKGPKNNSSTSHFVHSIYEDVNEIFESMDCAMFSYGNAKRFVHVMDKMLLTCEIVRNL